jgi:hypothetical protein
MRRWVRTGVLLSVFWSGAAAVALAQTRPEEELDQLRNEEIQESTQRRLGLEVRTAAVFDSNIDHDEGDLDSFGGIASIRTQFRARRFRLHYQAGIDRFTQTVRWNRTTHRLRADLRQRLASQWRLNTMAEASLGHTTEDREVVGNYYTLFSEIEHPFNPERRLFLYGMWRFREYGGDAGRREDSAWNVGAEFTHDVTDRHQWSAGYRYEEIDAHLVRSAYVRHAYTVEYRVEPTTLDTLQFELTFRPRRYPHRIVELDSGDVFRRDERWSPRFTWTRMMTRGVRLELDYGFDRQLSNELDENFRAHRVAYTLNWTVR